MGVALEKDHSHDPHTAELLLLALTSDEATAQPLKEAGQGILVPIVVPTVAATQPGHQPTEQRMAVCTARVLPARVRMVSGKRAASSGVRRVVREFLRITIKDMA